MTTEPPIVISSLPELLTVLQAYVESGPEPLQAAVKLTLSSLTFALLTTSFKLLLSGYLYIVPRVQSWIKRELGNNIREGQEYEIV